MPIVSNRHIICWKKWCLSKRLGQWWSRFFGALPKGSIVTLKTIPMGPWGRFIAIPSIVLTPLCAQEILNKIDRAAPWSCNWTTPEKWQLRRVEWDPFWWGSKCMQFWGISTTIVHEVWIVNIMTPVFFLPLLCLVWCGDIVDII